MKYWVWLQAVLGTASETAGKLLKNGITARYVYNNIEEKGLLTASLIKKAKETKISFAENIVNRCNREGIQIITPDNELYPKSFFNISDPPVCLYCKGEFPNFNVAPSLCVVGPRRVSSFGYKSAYSLSARFAIAGFVVISGGAIGCDYAAHDGALIHGGTTVAVLGNGFGSDYLAQNIPLRERIEKQGCLITEYLPDTPASRFTFPKRNRLMAALAQGTVLIEAPKRSGALITAGYAVEYNKDLFVLPGTPGNPQYEGSNLLLRDGAKPLLEVSDVFSEYLWNYSDKIDIEKAYAATLIKPTKNIDENSKSSKTKIQKSLKNTEEAPKLNENQKINKKILPEHLSKNAKIVYNQLDKQIFTTDDLLGICLNTGEITSALGELEIYGFVMGLPGGRYCLK